MDSPLTFEEIENLIKKLKELQVPLRPKAKTIVQWTEEGGYELKNGEGVEVASEKDESVVYVVKRAKQGTSVYCSCPAWKYQRLSPVCRTCKHCTAVLGKKADAERVAHEIEKQKDK
jgi:hypothetical protein